MTESQHPDPTRPTLQAAVLLLARDYLPVGSEAPRTTEGIMALTGAGRSQAYELRNRLKEVLPTVLGTPGRPPSPPLESTARMDVLVAVRDFLIKHPGAVNGTGVRHVYSAGFKRFVVGLTAPGQAGEGLSLVALAEATGVPEGTLKEWLYPPSAREATPPAASPEPATPDAPGVASPPLT